MHPQQPVSSWPVGRVVGHLAVADCIRNAHTPARVVGRTCVVAPSVGARLKQLLALTESDVWNTYLPFVEVNENVANTIAPLWMAALSVTTDHRETNEFVPVSTMMHEDIQLEYKRPGVPVCSLGDHCAALLYPGNQGPLHIYLMPSMQRALDNKESCLHQYDENATCLLCIRRDIHGACLAWDGMIPSPYCQIRRQAIIPAPFTNVVDVPTGYRASAFIPNGNRVFDNANIVGVCGSLTVKYRTRDDIFYFDQESIKVRPPHFLGLSTTAYTR